MTTTRSHDQIVDIARSLFAKRSYESVTVREIACVAELSPAMVMKCVGSKEKLFAEAMTLSRDELPPDVPVDCLGEFLVQRIFDRWRDGAAEPSARAAVMVLARPETRTSVLEFVQDYVSDLARLLGTDQTARTTAELVLAALHGLAHSMAAFEIVRPTEADVSALVGRYGAAVQSIIDSR